MNKRYIKIFYLVVLNINLSFIISDSIRASSAASAASAAATASRLKEKPSTDTPIVYATDAPPTTSSNVNALQTPSYPPRNWYLSCFCWNASWSSIEWARYLLWELKKQKILNDDELNSIIDKDSNYIQTKISDNINDFKTSKISPDLCRKFIKNITCRVKSKEVKSKENVTFEIYFQTIDDISSTDDTRSTDDTSSTDDINSILERNKKSLQAKLEERFTNQITAFVNHVSEQKYDVICLQECPNPFLEIIKSKLSSKDYEFCSDSSATQSGCCIIYNKSHKLTNQSCKSNNRNNIKSQEVQINIPPLNHKQISTTIASIHFNKNLESPLVERFNATRLGNELYDFMNHISFTSSASSSASSATSQKPAIIFGDFNSFGLNIKSLFDLKHHKKISFFVGNYGPYAIDHCIFNQDIFEALAIDVLNVDRYKSFYKQISQNHPPFVTNIIYKDIFIESNINPFIDKVNKLILDQDADSDDILKDSETLQKSILKLFLEYAKNTYASNEEDLAESLNSAINALSPPIAQASDSAESSPRRAKKRAAQSEKAQEEQRNPEKELIIEITKLHKVIASMEKTTRDTTENIDSNIDSLLKEARNIFYMNTNIEEFKKNTLTESSKQAIKANLRKLRDSTDTNKNKDLIDEILRQVYHYFINKNQKYSEQLSFFKELYTQIFTNDTTSPIYTEQKTIEQHIENIQKGISIGELKEREPLQIIETLGLKSKIINLLLMFPDIESNESLTEKLVELKEKEKEKEISRSAAAQSTPKKSPAKKK